MAIQTVPLAEKLDCVERLIIDERRGTGRRNEVLAAIAADIRGRMNNAPSVAAVELEQRLTAIKQSKTALGYERGKMLALAELVVFRWPAIKQALEMFGAEIQDEVVDLPSMMVEARR